MGRNYRIDSSLPPPVVRLQEKQAFESTLHFLQMKHIIERANSPWFTFSALPNAGLLSKKTFKCLTISDRLLRVEAADHALLLPLPFQVLSGSTTTYLKLYIEALRGEEVTLIVGYGQAECVQDLGAHFQVISGGEYLVKIEFTKNDSWLLIKKLSGKGTSK